jgi:hypothetical protein
VTGARQLPREALAAAALALAGIAGLLLSHQPWPMRIANAVFYATLVVNTYLSLRFFARLEPIDRDERAIDAALAILYLLLAAAIGAAVPFAAVSTALFAASLLKYGLLLRIVTRRDALTRKLAINTLGLVLCAAALAVAAAGYPMAAAWLQATLFVVANIYLLAVRPMYA